uniref:hypothetical protein n=1 Tax=Wolbachia endosymbiont of Pentidionis agamae TaxID=3110435 RepID=UPI002FD0C732
MGGNNSKEKKNDKQNKSIPTISNTIDENEQSIPTTTFGSNEKAKNKKKSDNHEQNGVVVTKYTRIGENSHDSDDIASLNEATSAMNNISISKHTESDSSTVSEELVCSSWNELNDMEYLIKSAYIRNGIFCIEFLRRMVDNS